MALSIPSFTDGNTGVVVTNAYAQIMRSSSDPINFRVTIEFYTANPSTTEISAFCYRDYILPTADVTGVYGLYTYLQTLPEYSGSTLVD